MQGIAHAATHTPSHLHYPISANGIILNCNMVSGISLFVPQQHENVKWDAHTNLSMYFCSVRMCAYASLCVTSQARPSVARALSGFWYFRSNFYIILNGISGQATNQVCHVLLCVLKVWQQCLKLTSFIPNWIYICNIYESGPRSSSPASDDEWTGGLTRNHCCYLAKINCHISSFAYSTHDA